MNRRFVAFYFNVGRGGLGYDADAAAFIARIDKRFSGRMVPTPPVWVFAPDGSKLTTISNYAPKDEFFGKLVALLREHPAFDQNAKDEQQALDAAKQKRRNAAAQLAAARINEELARYDQAIAGYERVVQLGARTAEGATAQLALARIGRYEKQWSRVKTHLGRLAKLPATLREPLAADVAAEEGHRLLARKDYAGAYALLSRAAKAYPDTARMGELHFYAGVAAWFQEKKDWANFHWCWVMRNISDDYHYMRCYMAATADAMIYANPELGGYRSKSGRISHRLADAARDRAMLDYEKLLPDWAKRKVAQDTKPRRKEEDF